MPVVGAYVFAALAALAGAFLSASRHPRHCVPRTPSRPVVGKELMGFSSRRADGQIVESSPGVDRAWGDPVVEFPFDRQEAGQPVHEVPVDLSLAGGTRGRLGHLTAERVRSSLVTINPAWRSWRSAKRQCRIQVASPDARVTAFWTSVSFRSFSTLA